MADLTQKSFTDFVSKTTNKFNLVPVDTLTGKVEHKDEDDIEDLDKNGIPYSSYYEYAAKVTVAND